MPPFFLAHREIPGKDSCEGAKKNHLTRRRGGAEKGTNAPSFCAKRSAVAESSSLPFKSLPPKRFWAGKHAGMTEYAGGQTLL
jgi:hypothetical protein